MCLLTRKLIVCVKKLTLGNTYSFRHQAVLPDSRSWAAHPGCAMWHYRLVASGCNSKLHQYNLE